MPAAFSDRYEDNYLRKILRDTKIIAMVGASDAHVTIAGNVYMALRQHLRGGPCSEFITDIKLRRGK